jgi:hypothetical protein
MDDKEKYDFQAEDDFRTLERAQEIQNDPKRLKKAIAAGKRRKAITVDTIKASLKGLRI